LAAETAGGPVRAGWKIDRAILVDEDIVAEKNLPVQRLDLRL